MRIKSIDIGAFGKTRDFHLKPKDGLNVIYGPNGSGKTTVMSFLKAIFYGAGKGKDRAKYIPWYGDKMSGSVTYSDDGKTYVCQGTFGKTAKGDKCTTFDDVNGRVISELPMGQSLFSMSEATFSKTAFITSEGSRISNKGDDEIAEKLSNLRTTGDEGVSFSTASSDIDGYMSKLIAKRGTGGRIQQLEQGIEQQKSELKEAYDRLERSCDGRAALERAYERRAQLETEIKRLTLSSERMDYRNCRDIKKSLDSIEKGMDVTNLPQLMQQIRECELHIEAKEKQFAELSNIENNKEKISEQDFTDITAIFYEKRAKGKKGLTILMAALAVAFLILGFVNYLFFIGTLIFAVLTYVYRPKKKGANPNLSTALEKFGEYSYESFRARYMEQSAREALKVQNIQKAEKLNEEKQEQVSKLEELKRTAASMYGFSDTKKLSEILSREQDISARRIKLTASFETALRGRSFEEMERKFGNDTAVDEPDALEKLVSARKALSENSGTIASLERAMGALEGDSTPPDEIERRIAELTEKRDDLKFRYDSLSIALSVLNEAYDVMEGEFGEKLNDRAGEILLGITKSYSTARMNRDYDIKLSEDGEIHELDNFSTGLFEQTCLSFRLAMLSLMDGDVPVFLDDVLMSYDDERAENFISFLKDYAENKQIFLFTCRRRDYNIAMKYGVNCAEL